MGDRFWYRLALGYGGLLTLVWLAIAGLSFRLWRYGLSEAATLTATTGQQDMINRAGSVWVSGAYAAVTAAVVGFASFKLWEMTWDSWDWATVVIGGAAVFSVVLLCARGRVMAYIPLTLFPLWGLLYHAGVKRTCGVPVTRQARLDERVAAAAPVTDLRQEQAELAGLQQSLQVFELERGLDTATFMRRYAEGLEDDTPDNTEWFALGRLARRAAERLASAAETEETAI